MTTLLSIHYTICSYLQLQRLFASGLLYTHSNRSFIENWLASEVDMWSQTSEGTQEMKASQEMKGRLQ